MPTSTRSKDNVYDENFRKPVGTGVPDCPSEKHTARIFPIFIANNGFIPTKQKTRGAATIRYTAFSFSNQP
jgi:hypothetical protein